MLEWYEYVKVLIGLLVIVNPLGCIPVFLSLTGEETQRSRRRIALRSTATVGLVLVLTALAGERILAFFGISLSAFRVGGGILVLLMAIDMLHARRGRIQQTSGEAEEAQEKDDVAVVPLGIPLLAGPGAISTIVLYANQGAGWSHLALLCVAIAFVAAATWIALSLAVLIGPALGKTGINIATRLEGLLLAAIAVEFIAQGLKELFPALVG